MTSRQVVTDTQKELEEKFRQWQKTNRSVFLSKVTTQNIINKKGWPKKEAVMKAGDQNLEKIICSEIVESRWKTMK